MRSPIYLGAESRDFAFFAMLCNFLYREAPNERQIFWNTPGNDLVDCALSVNVLIYSVADLEQFDEDPDPTVIWIRIEFY